MEPIKNRKSNGNNLKDNRVDEKIQTSKETMEVIAVTQTVDY